MYGQQVLRIVGYHNIISVAKVHEVHEIGADNLNLKTKEKM